MAHWKLGHREDARKWYDKAAGWMDKNQPKNDELGRFRVEAEQLLGVAAAAEARRRFQLLLQQGKHAEAAKAAEESLREFPDDSQAYRDAALVLARCLPIAAQDARFSEAGRKAGA